MQGRCERKGVTTRSFEEAIDAFSSRRVCLEAFCIPAMFRAVSNGRVEFDDAKNQ